MNKIQMFKKTTRLAVCLTALLVAGCAVDYETIEAAIESCKQNGGLAVIYANGAGPTVDEILCNNGASFRGN